MFNKSPALVYSYTSLRASRRAFLGNQGNYFKNTSTRVSCITDMYIRLSNLWYV